MLKNKRMLRNILMLVQLGRASWPPSNQGKGLQHGGPYMHLFSGWCFTSNSSYHKGGRTVIAWNPNSFVVTILAILSQIVYCKVATIKGREAFFCTFLYAFNEANGRLEAWRDFKEIAKGCNGSWILTGDFNYVLNLDERIWSVIRPQETEAFRSCMDACGLKDMSRIGYFYT